MELYYLLVQRSLWTVQLFIILLITAEGRFSYKRLLDRRQLRGGPPPEILPDPQNITVHRHERAILKCRVNHRGTKNVQWGLTNSSHPLTINNLTWTSDTRFSVKYTKHNKTLESWDLIIDDALPSYNNAYECQISSIVTHLRKVSLTVLPTIRKISPEVSIYGTTLLDSRETINLTCNASGAERAPESVDWFHDGIIIRPRDDKWRGRIRIYMEVSRRSLLSKLIIEKSGLQDSGSYICRSSDREFDSIGVHVLEDSDPPNRPPRTNSEEMVVDLRNSAKVFSVNFTFILIITFILWT